MNRPFGLSNESLDTMSVLYVAAWVVLIIYIFLTMCYTKRTVDLSDIEDIVTHFHEDPNYDDFEYVIRNGKKLPQKTYKCWLYGVSLTQPHFIEYAETARSSYIFTTHILSPADQREVQRSIRRAQTRPTADLLDCMWAIYFASGDRKYSEIVARTARGDIASCPEVAAAASWSYKSIMGARP